ncbi:hypothetical protein GQR58_003222 [Nymphon striatum]|nr:hypothetical protein GQR58_003222 [Nymphon striatum]
MPLSLTQGTDLDWGKVFASSLGLFLLLSSFAAAGLFLSAISSQPIIAAISSFGLLMFLVVLLSEGTQLILSRLDKPLELVAYVPDDAQVHTALKKLVKKYKKYKNDITLEFVNPDLDPERAKKDGIGYSGQVLIKLGDKSETVNSVAEQNVVNVFQRLSRDKPRLVVFLEGHNERSVLESNSSGLSQLVEVLESKGFTFQPHNLIRTQNIPQDASFVVIAAPQDDYLEGEVSIIKDYINKGGNVLWLHDPVATGSPLHGLDNIEQQLGLEIHEGTMVDANQDLQAMLGIKHPAAIAVIDYSDIEITADLTAHTIFPFATAILQDAMDDKDVSETPLNWQFTPFLSTLATSWLEVGEMEGNVKFDDGEDKSGPLTMGMALSRPLSDGVMSGVDANNSGDEKEHAEQRIVVVGDSDFMINSFIGQGSNLELASNIFNWLSTDDDLLSINFATASDSRLDMPKNILEIMNKQKLLKSLVLGMSAVLLASCAGVALEEEQKKASTHFYQHWVNSYEEQTNGNIVFRPSGSKEFPPSRFRMAYKFDLDGSCQYKHLSENDAHRMESCVYTKVGNKVYIYDNSGKLVPDLSFTLVAPANKDILLLRKGVTDPVKEAKLKKETSEKKDESAETLYDESMGEDVTQVVIHIAGHDDIHIENIGDEENREWKITQPVQIDADKSKVRLLFTLLTDPVSSSYDVAGKDLAKFGLDKDDTSISFNGVKLILGDLNQVSQTRYILKGDKIYLIVETVTGLLGMGVDGFRKNDSATNKPDIEKQHKDSDQR